MAHSHSHDHDHHDHDHGHGHAHDHGHHHHGHGHSHAPADFGAAFAIGVALNSAFVVAELIFGYAAQSLALISDAVHNLSDVMALLLAWCALWLSRKQPTDRHTYGYRRASILAALANAALLLVVVGGIAVEAIDRLRAPSEVASMTVLWVAALGIVINGATALLFMRGRHDDLNIRGAYLHMAADAGVSFGVVVAAAVTMATGWLWIDPVVSLGIAAVVLISGWDLARDSVNLALDAVPRDIALGDVKEYLAALDGVSEVHDLHIWAMSTNETALTAHLVRPGGSDDAFLHRCCEGLSHRFKINHATLQVEVDGAVCKLAPADVV
jgi:cobalt-zinc-cadmium efflux system protein